MIDLGETTELQGCPELLRTVTFACGHVNGLMPLRPADLNPDHAWPIKCIDDHDCHFCDLNAFRMCLNQVLNQYEEAIAPLVKRLRNNVLYMKSITPEGTELRKAHWSEMNEIKIDFVRVVQEGDERWTSRWGSDSDGGLVEEFIDKAWTLGESIV